MQKASFIYSPRFKEFDLGPDHPLQAKRVVRTYELTRACHFLEGENVVLSRPTPAREDDLALVHTPEYIEAVRATNEGRPMPNPARFGFGTVDNPIVTGMYGTSALVAGASVMAADLVADGTVSVAFNPGGGWHHAHRDHAAGFCIFNDPAIACAHLIQRCGEGAKVAYLDIDAHHGDGVQEAFYDRRDVLTISVHESGRWLFPGTGEVGEIGTGEGEGYSVNVPLAPYTTDEIYLWAFRETVIPLLEAFQPDFVVTQLGVDTHCLDPLTHMMLTTHGYLKVIDLIAKHAPRWVAIGGGGYEITVVPRAWTLAWARMIEAEAPEYIPEKQAKHYHRDAEGRAPLHDPRQPELESKLVQSARAFAEITVTRVRERVFPYHGIAGG